MPDEFSGTNTEKIEKLISAVVTLQTSARIGFWTLGLTLPLLVALGVYLVQRSYENSSKLDRLEYRLDAFEYRLQGFENRFQGFENRLQGLESRLQVLEKEIARAELSRVEQARKLDAVLERIERRLEAIEKKPTASQ